MRRATPPGATISALPSWRSRPRCRPAKLQSRCRSPPGSIRTRPQRGSSTILPVRPSARCRRSGAGEPSAAGVSAPSTPVRVARASISRQRRAHASVRSLRDSARPCSCGFARAHCTGAARPPRAMVLAPRARQRCEGLEFWLRGGCRPRTKRPSSHRLTPAAGDQTFRPRATLSTCSAATCGPDCGSLDIIPGRAPNLADAGPLHRV